MLIVASTSSVDRTAIHGMYHHSCCAVLGFCMWVSATQFSVKSSKFDLLCKKKNGLPGKRKKKITLYLSTASATVLENVK